MKILITGSSSGFGKLMVETLLKGGHAVAASMRNTTGKNKGAAEELKKAGAKIVDIDVTSDESVDKGVAEAIRQLSGLDAVVNNAGFGYVGLQEVFTVCRERRVAVFQGGLQLTAVATDMGQPNGLPISKLSPLPVRAGLTEKTSPQPALGRKVANR